MKSIIFLGGRSATGKTASLRNLKGGDLKKQEKVLYLNCEAKDLPFKSGFKIIPVTDPYQLHGVSNDLIKQGADGLKKFDTVIVDSITACMDLFATKYIGKDCPNKMGAWGDYKSFYSTWAKQMLPQIPQDVIVLAHTDAHEDKDTLKTYTQAVVQGSLKGIGLEADFGLVVNTDLVALEKLEDYTNSHLNITDEEKLEEFKYVIQTCKTLETKSTKIRSPMGMWDKNETFIDSDIQIVLDKHKQFFK